MLSKRQIFWPKLYFLNSIRLSIESLVSLLVYAISLVHATETSMIQRKPNRKKGKYISEILLAFPSCVFKSFNRIQEAKSEVTFPQKATNKLSTFDVMYYFFNNAKSMNVNNY